MDHGRGYAFAASLGPNLRDDDILQWRRSRNSFAEGRNGASALRVAGRTAAATVRGSDYGLIPAAEAVRSACSELPTELTAAMMVIEIPTTISPYSMAVAPDSLDKKSASNFMTHSGLKNTPPFPFFFCFERRIMGGHALKKSPLRGQLLSKV